MSDAGTGADSASSRGRIRDAGSSTSDAVLHAASVFEEELTAGIADAERLERRFSAERRIDPDELRAITQRFRSDGHDVIDILAERLGDFSSDDMRSLAQRFTSDAHNLVEIFANLVNMAPDVVNQLMAGQREPADRENPLEGGT